MSAKIAPACPPLRAVFLLGLVAVATSDRELLSADTIFSPLVCKLLDMSADR